MSKQLLHKTLKAYVVFSLVVLLVSAPLFYWVIEKLYIDEADETLYLLKDEFIKYNQPSFKISDIPTWNAINRNVKIEEPKGLKEDSLFQTFYLDTLVHEHEPYRVLFSPIVIEDNTFALQAKLNLVESEDMIESIALLFCLILSVLLIGLYFITKSLSNRLWRPFYSTLDQIEKFDLNKSDKPIWHATDIEEFARLNQSIDKLLEKNISVYRSQREFTENASHELQTPLAIVQAKLDTLAQHLPLTTELSETLTQLMEATSRLARTNKNLLLLSKIDNNQYPEAEEISVEAVVQKQLIFFKEQATDRDIKIQMNASDGLHVHANLNLFEVAISNLLLNGLRHNVSGGVVTVEINGDELTISNPGNPQSLSTARLFQRFSTQGSEKGGSGLGLAIVKKIADLNSWTISYSYEDHLHVFRLRF